MIFIRTIKAGSKLGMILGPPSLSLVEKLPLFDQTGNGEAAGLGGPARLVGQHCRLSSGRRLSRVHYAGYCSSRCAVRARFQTNNNNQPWYVYIFTAMLFHPASYSARVTHCGQHIPRTTDVAPQASTKPGCGYISGVEALSRHPMARGRPKRELQGR
jgi:hypothetical protein